MNYVAESYGEFRHGEVLVDVSEIPVWRFDRCGPTRGVREGEEAL